MTTTPTASVETFANRPDGALIAALRLAQQAHRAAQGHLDRITARLTQALEIERREVAAVDFAIEAEREVALDRAAGLRHERISCEARRDVAARDRAELQQEQHEAQEQLRQRAEGVAIATRAILHAEIREAFEAYQQTFKELQRQREALLAAYLLDTKALTDAQWHIVGRRLPATESMEVQLPMRTISIYDANADWGDELDRGARGRLAAAAGRWRLRIAELQAGQVDSGVPPEAA